MKRLLLLFAILSFALPALAGPFGIFGPPAYQSVCPNCSAYATPVVLATPIRHIPALPVAQARVILARPVGDVPNNVTADLQQLDADATATAAAQATVTNDAANVATTQANLAAVTATAQAAVTAAQAQQTTDTTALTTAQQTQATQLAQTIADIQAAYGITPAQAKAMLGTLPRAQAAAAPATRYVLQRRHILPWRR